jgi:hypothetical protein
MQPTLNEFKDISCEKLSSLLIYVDDCQSQFDRFNLFRDNKDDRRDNPSALILLPDKSSVFKFVNKARDWNPKSDIFLGHLDKTNVSIELTQILLIGTRALDEYDNRYYSILWWHLIKKIIKSIH